MAQESKKLQVTFNGELLELMEAEATRLGLTLTEYIRYCVISKIDTKIQKES